MGRVFARRIGRLAKLRKCAPCPDARVGETLRQHPRLPRWLTTLHGFVTFVVLTLLVVAAVSFAAVVIVAVCSGWDGVCDFLARFRVVQI